MPVGKYTQPTPVDVASALAYATQQANGTHQLNFGGVGPNVYNPSTYSYLLAKTTGSDPGLGGGAERLRQLRTDSGTAVVTDLRLRLPGTLAGEVRGGPGEANVPGAVAPTSAEANAYACGDLTPADVQAGKTTPTCGVVNTASNNAAANAAAGKSVAAGSTAAGASGSSGSGSSGSGSSGSGGAADPSVSLSGATGLAFTGSNPLPLLVVGAVLLSSGWWMRRRLMRRRRASVEVQE